MRGYHLRWYRLLLGAMVLLGALTGVAQNGTVAYFQSAATGTGDAFTVGTIDIANSPTSALLAPADLVPGEAITAPLTVTNSGTLPLQYALSSTVTNADGKGIGAQLDLTIKVNVTACTNAGFGASGTLVYGPAAPLGTLGSSLNLIGTPSAFPNGGRPLAASAGETLCVQVSLPAGTGASYQGAATTATFTFAAQQV